MDTKNLTSSIHRYLSANAEELKHNGLQFAHLMDKESNRPTLMRRSN